MKVGILTFCFGRNYGQLLQAYALQKAIASLGYDVELIDYVPQEKVRYFRDRSDHSWVHIGWRTYGPRVALIRRLRAAAINRWKSRHLRLSRQCNCVSELAQVVAGYNVVTVGSDQVWNGRLHSWTEYMGHGILNHCDRWISYASCCGEPAQPEEVIRAAKSTLGAFRHIGVRNSVTAEFVKEATGRDATVVVDPTLLTDLFEAESGGCARCEYGLAYFLHREDLVRQARALTRIAEQLRYPVWAVADGDEKWADVQLPGTCRNFHGLSPGVFLSLVKNARYVVTDSFHGAITAIKYDRPLLIMSDRNWRSHRMLDIVSRYGLEHRYIGFDDQVDGRLLCDCGDLSLVRERISQHRDVSRTFLGEALRP